MNLGDPEFTSHEGRHEVPVSVVADYEIGFPFHMVEDLDGCILVTKT